MKTLLLPEPGIKQEISTTTHALHQDALFESTKAIVQSLGVSSSDWTILFGLDSEEDSGDWVISPGAVYHDEEIFFCDGIEGNDGGNVPVLTITETNIGQPAKFSDFIDRHVHKERKLVLSFAAEDSSDCNYNELIQIRAKIESLLQVTTRITEAILPKANKAQGSWTDIALNEEYSARNGMTPQYRIDQFGIVHLRGQIIIDSSNSGFVTEDEAIPNCPTGSGGSASFAIAALESSVGTVIRININASGRIVLDAGYAASHVGDSFFLNGISYAQEEY